MKTTELHPHLDMLADFMYASNFKENFSRPLHVVERADDSSEYALIPEICRWLGIERNKIELCPRDMGTQNPDPAGMIEIFKDGGARISYCNDVNPCWKRFIIIKELMHLVIEHLDYNNLPPIDVSEMLSAVCRPGASNIINCYDANSTIGSAEQNAWLLAEQLLVPWFEYEQIISSNDNDYDEAFKYRVPRHIIFEIRGSSRRVNLMGDAVESAYNRKCELMTNDG